MKKSAGGGYIIIFFEIFLKLFISHSLGAIEEAVQWAVFEMLELFGALFKESLGAMLKSWSISRFWLPH